MKTVGRRMSLLFVPPALALLALAGCGSAPATPAEKADLTDDGQTRLRGLERDNPDLKATVDNSYGYAIFPSIAKGGLVFEAASGQGVVYEQNQYIGFAHLTLVNFGAVIGGEDYTELLVFKTKDAMADFEANRLKFDATASAVALKAGARADAKFVNDVAAFTKSNSGFDIDASIGGQQFTFTRDPSVAPPAATPPATPIPPAAPAVPPAAPPTVPPAASPMVPPTTMPSSGVNPLSSPPPTTTVAPMMKMPGM
jgi:lipid-binding SYLF domain-containing protein